MVAGNPVSVQSPARKRLEKRVRTPGRRAASPGVWANVALFSFTIRYVGNGASSRSRTGRISSHIRAAMAFEGSPAKASAALTVTDATSSRMNNQ